MRCIVLPPVPRTRISWKCVKLTCSSSLTTSANKKSKEKIHYHLLHNTNIEPYNNIYKIR